ncbi:hypothetical protein [Acidithiobacillus sp.]|nr:hypothetical protein [Acidithiobacillus sp.]
MSDPDLLNVWHEQCQVGQLWRNSAGAIGFRYDPEPTYAQLSPNR